MRATRRPKDSNNPMRARVRHVACQPLHVQRRGPKSQPRGLPHGDTQHGRANRTGKTDCAGNANLQSEAMNETSTSRAAALGGSFSNRRKATHWITEYAQRSSAWERRQPKTPM